MKIITVEKPIKGKKTQVAQAFDELMKGLPINSWALKQKHKK